MFFFFYYHKINKGAHDNLVELVDLLNIITRLPTQLHLFLSKLLTQSACTNSHHTFTIGVDIWKVSVVPCSIHPDPTSPDISGDVVCGPPGLGGRER